MHASACLVAALLPSGALAAKFPEFADAGLERGRAVWMGTCEACHGNPDSDAPQALDRAAWKPRLAKGKATLYEHALRGFKGPTGSEMPARGGNRGLGDDDVRAAVDYMAKVAGP